MPAQTQAQNLAPTEQQQMVAALCPSRNFFKSDSLRCWCGFYKPESMETGCFHIQVTAHPPVLWVGAAMTLLPGTDLIRSGMA